MNCRKCGHELDPHYTFCPNCGRSITTARKTRYSSDNDNAYIKKINEIQHPSPDLFKKVIKVKTDNEIAATSEAKNIDAETPEIPKPMKEYQPEYYQPEDEVKHGSRARSFIIGLLITILLLGCGSFAGYYAYNRFMGTSTDEYISSIAKLNGQIIKANNDIADIISKDTKTLPVADILKQTPAARTAFNTISTNYGKISAPSIYAKSNESLGEAIRLNKLIYDQLELILKNPAHADIQKNMAQLSQYIDECMNYYSTIEAKDVSFTLPNELLSLQSRLQPWVVQKQAEYSKVTSLITTFTKYFENMDKLFVNYDSSAADFNQIIKSVRNGQEPWSALFTQIDNSEKIIKAVKTDYQKQTVPTELKSVNSRFGPILDEMLGYYSKLRLAAETEMNFNVVKPGDPEDIETGGQVEQDNKPTPKPTAKVTPKANATPTPTPIVINDENDIELLYQDAAKQYESASLNYQKFAIDLKGEKDKFLDPEYVLNLKSVKK